MHENNKRFRNAVLITIAALAMLAQPVLADELLVRARAEYEAGNFDACNQTYKEAATKGEVLSRLDKRTLGACHCGADDTATIAQGLRELEEWSTTLSEPADSKITNMLVAMCTALLSREQKATPK